MNNNLVRKMLVFALTTLFIFGAFLPGINGELSKVNTQKAPIKNQETSTLKFYTFDKTSSKECNANLSNGIAREISDKLNRLKNQTINHPYSEETKVLKQDFVDAMYTYGLIPAGMTKEYVLSLLNPTWLNFFNNKPNPKFKESFLNILKPVYKNLFLKTDTASAYDWDIFSNLASSGFGVPLPLFMLPRPRGVAMWFSSDGATAIGSLVIPKSFSALGSQQGFALGFVGVGLTISFGGETGFFFIGYAVYTMVQAEYILYLTPPNNPPVISDENPVNGANDVPLSLSKLSFRISDADNDKMDYTVTTSPNIGSGSGNNKKDGLYTIPISGLQGNTKYSWHVVVNDPYTTVEQDFSFTTELVGSIITNPSPNNGDTWVPVDTSQLSFNLMDKEGAPMDYTVQTSPNIGSSSGTNVGEGTYYVDVSGLDYTTKYTWYVNVTDGTYSIREIFNFKTQPIMIFNPFDEGWKYRKKITIHHSKIAGDLTDFPVLISRVDSDLKLKAQANGNDILFMDGTGVANRLLHEIELYDDSNGDLVAWVKIPELSNSADTVLYMYYGNPTCGSQQYPEEVWDSNYIAVLHMNDYPDNSHIQDSTSYKNNGNKIAANQPEEINSKIGKGQNFDGVDDFISIPNSNSLQSPETSVTITSWAYVNDWNGDDNWASICEKSTNTSRGQYGIQFSNIGRIDIDIANKKITIYTNFTPELHKWYFVAFSWDGSNIIIYLNGINIKEAQFSPNPKVNDNSLLIGANTPFATEYMDGILDEIRISNNVRSSSWISTEYNNQNNPSNFFTIGPEESAP